MDSNVLLAGVLFSSVGMGYFIYGKKQSMAMSMISGLALMIYPYFFDDLLKIIAIGILLIIMPFILKF